MTGALITLALAAVVIGTIAIAIRARLNASEWDERTDPEIPEFQPGEVRLAKRVTATQIRWETTND